LPRNRSYSYSHKATTTKIEIVEVVLPEGPITIKRYDPGKGRGRSRAKKQSISSAMIGRVAAAISSDVPINLDRVLGGSYNTRSALESLLLHTEEFYQCRPGRIEVFESAAKIKPGHKHIVWKPDDPHPRGAIREIATEIVISEVPSIGAIYEALVLPAIPAEAGLDINVRRRHAQIQIALVEIGRTLGFRTWVAQNDRGIVYKEKPLAEMEGVIISLDDEQLLSSFTSAVRAALTIDCIWFRNTRFMPAVIEIEHTTGVISGLTRMKNLQDKIPAFPTRWVIAAPDDDRDKVFRECAKDQFRSLAARFFPYSAIEELYSLCQRRKLRGVTDEFLDCFMESCLPALSA
jgi:type II restriction enzyme